MNDNGVRECDNSIAGKGDLASESHGAAQARVIAGGQFHGRRAQSCKRADYRQEPSLHELEA
jgi:hypothetical protein